MPRRAPLPSREQEICRRFTEFRADRGLSRADVARKLDRSQFTLANFDAMRAPVPFDVGYALCEAFNVSLRWLATGELPPTPFTQVAPEILSKIRPRGLFSRAYDQHLHRLVEERLAELAAAAGVAVEDLGTKSVVLDFRGVGGSQAQSHLERVREFIALVSSQMPEGKKLAFSQSLERVVFSFFPWEVEVPESAEGSKEFLTPNHPSSTVGAVDPIPTTWPKLKAALVRLTKQRGGKARLAADLGTTRQAVNLWLRQGSEPGAGITLRMIKWVGDLEKAQLNRAGATKAGEDPTKG